MAYLRVAAGWLVLGALTAGSQPLVLVRQLQLRVIVGLQLLAQLDVFIGHFAVNHSNSNSCIMSSDVGIDNMHGVHDDTYGRKDQSSILYEHSVNISEHRHSTGVHKTA